MSGEPTGYESATWQQFRDWLSTARPKGDVEALLRDYGAWIIERGGDEHAAHDAVGAIMRSLNNRDTDDRDTNDRTYDRTDAWAALFDKVYLSDTRVFNTNPNRLLVDIARTRRPGAALDVCMGEGRNTVWLATQGWRVTGVDVSPEGIARAQRRAADAEVEVTFVHQNADTFDYSRQAWDLISVFYAPVPIVERRYVARLTATLAVGGVVVIESFASDRDAPRRKPVDIDPLDLREAFAGFDIKRLDDLVDRPDWADAPQRLVRFVAERTS